MGRRRPRNRKRNRPDRFTESEIESLKQNQQNQGEWHNYNKHKNERFLKYYQSQGFIPEEEWDDFQSILRSPLPVTFRVTGCRSQAQELLSIIKSQFFSNLSCVKVDGNVVAPPKCLDWYPNEMAWQLNCSRKELRRHSLLNQLHLYIVAETESGNISRQEAVSMIPPIVLDIKPHHKVLDMCAAPGSKTAQLIEYLHSNESIPIPDGMVVANDRDNQRCYLMAHQVKRLQSPNVLIVNHDATLLPNLRLSKQDGTSNVVQYDRILTDVPCSGDGTMRKNPDVWRTWTPANSHCLHDMQLRILKRGLELLSVGGRLVYSTCSFNPVENEAVISTMLKKCEGCVEIIDVSDKLPGLKHINGVTSWKIMIKTGEWADTWEEIPNKWRKAMKKTSFPLPKEELEAMNIQRCVRVLPHHQNTGGFFIAALEKKKELPWKKQTDQSADMEDADKSEADAEVPNDDNLELNSEINENLEENNDPDKKLAETAVTDSNGTEDPAVTNIDAAMCDKNSETTKRKQSSEDSEQASKKSKYEGYKEDPFLFFVESDPIWESVRKFYKIEDTFPVKQLMYRCESGKKRNLYFVSELIRNVVEFNSDRIKFINLGVKVLSRNPSPLVPDCDFRLTQEGVYSLHSHFPGRQVQLLKDDLIALMKEENPLFDNFSKSAQKHIGDLSVGSVIFHFKPSESDPTPNCDIVICGWRGKTSLRPFLKDNDRTHYLRLCGIDWIKLKEDMKAKLKAEQSKPDTGGDANVATSKNDDEAVEESCDDYVKSSKKFDVLDSGDDLEENDPGDADNDQSDVVILEATKESCETDMPQTER